MTVTSLSTSALLTKHTTCYNDTNHWNALTDGNLKYVFKAWNASEQLFNLSVDPGETIDVSQEPAYQIELLVWRQRMVEQFIQEGRGPQWVANGTLLRRTVSQLYSPNYPGKWFVYCQLLQSGFIYSSLMVLRSRSRAAEQRYLLWRWPAPRPRHCPAPAPR